MRVIIIVLLLIVLGFIGWKAAERFKIIEGPKDEVSDAVSSDDGADNQDARADREPALPSFDIVRVDRTGYAVIAGRAKPGSTVTIYANDDELATAPAEADGSWVIATDTPLEAGPVELSVSMTTDDGLTVRSEETILIYVPERAGDAPLVLRTTPGGATEVLQDPREMPEGMGPLTLDVIDYDDSGAVIFSGRAEPNSIVQLFFNSQLLGQTRATDGGNSDEDEENKVGRWTIAPAARIAPGVYQLLVIQLDAEGRVAYAIEVPFERATADQIQLRDGKVIVQPGNSLWRISRRAYGQGAQYTIIYEANEDQIRDPDLIFPGQIFDVPDSEEEDETDG